jgi:hypothetical protein
MAPTCEEESFEETVTFSTPLSEDVIIIYHDYPKAIIEKRGRSNNSTIWE